MVDAILKTKNMRTLRYGGDLVPGDFIAVSNGNHIDFGWYCGDGRGTLQYYSLRIPSIIFEEYQSWKANPQNSSLWRAKDFEKHGFSKKMLWKSYINAVHKTRVIKIVQPEDILTEQEDIKSYQISKQALIELNILKQ